MSIKEYRERKRREAQAAEVASLRDEADATAALLGTSGGTARRNYDRGELVMTEGAAYVAIQNIPRTAALVEGVNVRRTDVEELLNQLNKKED